MSSHDDPILMTEKKNTEILIIAEGCYPSGVDHVGYSDIGAGSVPNIAEYDKVIIDLVNMNEDCHWDFLRSPQFNIKAFHNLLWAKHELILILDKQLVKVGGSTREITQNLPISIRLREEYGNKIQGVDSEFQEYFKTQVGDHWCYYLDHSSNVVFSETSLIFPAHIESLRSDSPYVSHPRPYAYIRNIATNGFGKPVSFSVIYGCRRGEGPSQHSGRIIFLQPPLETNSPEEAIGTLLAGYGFPMKTQPPSWVSNFRVPGEGRINEQLNELESKIEKMKERAERIKEKKSKEIDHFKTLLYETEDSLRDVVWDTLERLGFMVIRYDNKREDGSIEFEQETVLIETKGTTKSAKTKDVRQLLDWMHEYHYDMDSKQNEEPRGLFIVNHYRLAPPDKRAEPFPPDVKRLIRRTGNKLIVMTSFQLFSLFCEGEEGTMKREDIRRHIMENNGIYEP